MLVFLLEVTSYNFCGCNGCAEHVCSELCDTSGWMIFPPKPHRQPAGNTLIFRWHTLMVTTVDWSSSVRGMFVVMVQLLIKEGAPWQIGEKPQNMYLRCDGEWLSKFIGIFRPEFLTAEFVQNINIILSVYIVNQVLCFQGYNKRCTGWLFFCWCSQGGRSDVEGRRCWRRTTTTWADVFSTWTLCAELRCCSLLQTSSPLD